MSRAYQNDWQHWSNHVQYLNAHNLNVFPNWHAHEDQMLFKKSADYLEYQKNIYFCYNECNRGFL